MKHHARETCRAGARTKPVTRYWRGGLAALAALVTLAAVGCSSPASSPGHAGSRSGVTGGALFGGDIPLVSQQAKLGRSLPIVRVYDRIGETFPQAEDQSLLAGGKTLLVSLDTVPPRGPSYASIAAGQHDATIGRFLRSVEHAAVTHHLGAIYICFEHEANVARHHAGLGSPAQFVQAWDHVHQLAVSMHLNWNQGGRLHWVFILGRYAYTRGIAGQYWPGANELDVVGVDGYNSAGCVKLKVANFVAPQGTRARTPADIFNPALQFARSHGRLPVFIVEWASVPYAVSSVQPSFIHQMQAYVSANREIAAALYWNGHVPGCDYSLNNRPAALSALAAMSHSTGLQGHIVTGP